MPETVAGQIHLSHLRILRATYFYDLVRKQGLTGLKALHKDCHFKRLPHSFKYDMTPFYFSCLIFDNRHLASLLSQNFTPVIIMQIQKNKRTTWYFILFYFSASLSLIGSWQKDQRNDVTTDFLVLKY